MIKLYGLELATREFVEAVNEEIENQNFALLNLDNITFIEIDRYYRAYLKHINLEKCFIVSANTLVRNRIEQLVNENIYAND